MCVHKCKRMIGTVGNVNQLYVTAAKPGGIVVYGLVVIQVLGSGEVTMMA